MQAYTKYHHCSPYTSWEMKSNIRVDANVDGLRLTNKQMENQIPLSHHAKSRHAKGTNTSDGITKQNKTKNLI